MSETYIAQMDALLAEKRKNGTLGVRLMVHDSRDFTSDDIAHDFCKMEAARLGNQVVRLEHLGF